MKKIISVLFAASLMFVVFACAQPKAEEVEVTEEQTEQTEVPAEEEQIETVDTTVTTEEAPAENAE